MNDADRIDIFEAIRKEVTPTAPSRDSCFFAFAARADALEARNSWGMFEGKSPEPIVIQDGANVFLGDADFYTHAGAHGTLRTAAYLYWLGRKTQAPKMEYLVDGTVYFQNWQTFPTL